MTDHSENPADISCLNRNDLMTIRWMCSTKLTDKVTSGELRNKVVLWFVKNVLRRGRIRWYGHLQHMNPDTRSRKKDKMIVTGSNSTGHPRKAWLKY